MCWHFSYLTATWNLYFLFFFTLGEAFLLNMGSRKNTLFFYCTWADVLDCLVKYYVARSVRGVSRLISTLNWLWLPMSNEQPRSLKLRLQGQKATVVLMPCWTAWRNWWNLLMQLVFNMYSNYHSGSLLSGGGLCFETHGRAWQGLTEIFGQDSWCLYHR